MIVPVMTPHKNGIAHSTERAYLHNAPYILQEPDYALHTLGRHFREELSHLLWIRTRLANAANIMAKRFQRRCALLCFIYLVDWDLHLISSYKWIYEASLKRRSHT